MQGDFSRTTFEATRGYRSVLLQQGRVLLDAEVNEQAAITAHHDETRTLDVVGPAGGPLPVEGGPGPFAVVDATGAVPSSATPWTQLRVTPGRYYVDGVLAESDPPPTGSGWPLTGQPHLPSVGSDAGLPEPPTSSVAVGARVGLYLDVWQHHVTADEQPDLLEAALGGPDTSTRSQTVWQVRWVQVPGKKSACPQVAALTGLRTPRRRMVATLAEPVASDDACRITTSGGYQLLENQLYRVQVHEVAKDGSATFLWSRENGSVVAGIRAFGTTTAGGTELVLDRDGRDEELSFRTGSLVEVTSEDRVLRGEPGFLATAGAPRTSGTSAQGITVPVTWIGTPPTFAGLGSNPVARRWEGGPLPVGSAAPTLLEGGISVQWEAGSAPLRTGDHWQVPARTVRLAYGLTARTGTIDWPVDGAGKPAMRPPLGVEHHVAPLAVLERTTAGWVVRGDCRTLFPPLTDLSTIDLVGGDGQEAMPGDPLPQAVRVVVRNGGVPVMGARVRATARTVPDSSTEGGVVAGTHPIPSTATAVETVLTDADGVAELWWRLDPGGSTTQTLHLTRLDPAQPATTAPVDVEVVATARLSVASQVSWDGGDRCTGFAEAHTVKDGLDQLITARTLALLGGDGQETAAAGQVLPRPVRVAVTSPCGPVQGAKVTADTDGGTYGWVEALDVVAAVPAGLGGETRVVAVTGADGLAEFWWAPEFPDGRSAVLDIGLEESPLPHVRITSSLDLGGGGRPGLHLKALRMGGKPFLNDDVITGPLLASGFTMALDGIVNQLSLTGKPVVHVLLSLPWPWPGDGDVWAGTPVGTRDVELAGRLDPNQTGAFWLPEPETGRWLSHDLWDVLVEHGWDRPIAGRLVIDSWAILGEDGQSLSVNGHAAARMVGKRTDLVLPTDDAVTGGHYEQWFWLQVGGGDEMLVVPEVVGLGRVAWRKALTDIGLNLDTLDVRTEVTPGVPKGRILSIDPPPGTPIDPKARVKVVISG